MRAVASAMLLFWGFWAFGHYVAGVGGDPLKLAAVILIVAIWAFVGGVAACIYAINKGWTEISDVFEIQE